MVKGDVLSGRRHSDRVFDETIEKAPDRVHSARALRTGTKKLRGQLYPAICGADEHPRLYLSGADRVAPAEFLHHTAGVRGGRRPLCLLAQDPLSALPIVGVGHRNGEFFPEVIESGAAVEYRFIENDLRADTSCIANARPAVAKPR
jgi:hypothetical protein